MARSTSDARVTMAVVAHIAGVDVSTVSRALKDDPRIPNVTRRRIRKIVSETGYAVNQNARRLRTGRSDQILVILNNISATFFPEVVEGIEDISSDRGVGVLVGSTRGSVAREEAMGRQLLTGVVDGLILLNGRVPSVLRNMPNHDRRIVAVSRSVAEGAIPLISIDHGKAMDVAVQHVLSLGHRCIAHIAGPQESPTFRARADSYKRNMISAGLEPWVKVAERFDIDTGFLAMKSLLASGGAAPGSRPTAVICASDEIAFGAMRAARQKGLGIPADIAFVGFDGLAIGAVSEPPLTTIRIPRRQMGWAGAEMLLDNIATQTKGELYRELPFELVVRESCGAAVMPALPD